MKERDRKESGVGMKVKKIEETKTFPSTLTCYKQNEGQSCNETMQLELILYYSPSDHSSEVGCSTMVMSLTFRIATFGMSIP